MDIYAYLIATFPALTSIVGIVIAVVKHIKSNKDTYKAITDSFNDLKAEVLEMKQYEELKAKLIQAHRDNVALRQQINQLLTKMDKVKRNDENKEV